MTDEVDGDGVRVVYPRHAGRPVLTPSVVAFADLLGTSANAAGERAQTTLEALDAALAAARAQSSIDEPNGWFHASWFSDNLAIAAPLPIDRSFQEGAVGFAILTLMWLQLRLALDGFFLRGGLTVGQHFADDAVSFGPALVEAVSLDKQGGPPRLVIGGAGLALIADHFTDHNPLDNPFSAELTRDLSDGTVFVSYLSASLEADDDDEAHEIITRHQSAVVQKLGEFDSDPPSAVLQKYMWTAQYHDWFCSQHFPDWHETRTGLPIARVFEPFTPRT